MGQPAGVQRRHLAPDRVEEVVVERRRLELVEARPVDVARRPSTIDPSGSSTSPSTAGQATPARAASSRRSAWCSTSWASDDVAQSSLASRSTSVR